ncbi:hypothetical protein AJ78_08801, partial [Emergomyces pasteurianus Ep9510]
WLIRDAEWSHKKERVNIIIDCAQTGKHRISGMTQGHNPPDEIHVDEDIIEARYPTLAPFYFAWQDIYENSFTAQGCDRGSGLDVFPDIAVRIGWEVEGFLIACWLVLQDDVEQVKYEPVTGMYSIKKDNLGDILRQFLTDMNALL